MGKVVFILRNPNCSLIYGVGGLIPSGSPPSTLKSTLDYSLQEMAYVMLYIHMSNLQLQRGGGVRVSIENLCVNEMTCYLFPEALPAWPVGRPRYIGKVNQKHTPLPLVEFLF